MKLLSCLTLLLLMSCNLRRGLETDVCTSTSLSASLASRSDLLLLVTPNGAIETLKEKSYPQTCVG